MATSRSLRSLSERRTRRLMRVRTDLPGETRADTLYFQALTALKADDHGTAVQHLTRALRHDPLHSDAMEVQAYLLGMHGKRQTAIRLLQNVIFQRPDESGMYQQLAEWLAEEGDTRAAAAAMQRCVQLSPNAEAPRRFLAGLFGKLGHEDHAAHWAQKAVSAQAFTVSEPTDEPRLTMILLQTAVAGNITLNGARTLYQNGHVNWPAMLDRRHIRVIRLQVDSLDRQPELVRKLPKADVIVNGMTIAERCETGLKQAERLGERLSLPVINRPEAVRETDRIKVQAQFAQHDGMLAPRITLFEAPDSHRVAAFRQCATDNGFTPPIIVRNPGVDGAQYTRLIPSLDDLTDDQLPDGDLYLIQHHDVWFTDARIPDARIYPKFRVVLVGETLYPAHLRFALDTYNVHNANSPVAMQEHPWLQDESERFLADPEGYLPEGQWEAMRQALLDQHLDFTGADFAVSTEPDTQGQLVIFEANPGMRSWLTDLPEDDSVQHAWQRILTAFHEHCCRRADVNAWDFQLPSGKPARAPALAELQHALDRHSIHNAAGQAARLARAYPRDTAIRRQHGESLSLLGQDRQALAILTPQARQHPGSIDAHTALVDAYLRAGQWRDAHRHLKTLNKSQRQNRAIQRREVAIMLQSGVEQPGILQQALAITDRLRKNSARDIELLRYRSSLQARLGDSDTALDGFARASVWLTEAQENAPDVTLAPTKTQLLIDWADVLVRTNIPGNLSLACHTLWEACQQRPYSRHTVTAWERLKTVLPQSPDAEHRNLVALHATMNRIWDGYKGEKLDVSFGDFGLPYQSFEPLWLPGTRPAHYRLDRYGLAEHLPDNARALDIGCNHGYLLMGLADHLAAGEGFDISQACVDVGNAVAQHLGHDHIQLTHQTFDDFMAQSHEGFDLVIACAVHRWIGKPLPEFGQALHDLCADGGLVLLESQGSRQIDATEAGFADNAEAIASAGFEVIRTGGLCDDGVNYREFQVLRKIKQG
ncbi:hypothetical protein GCM10022228_04800 [Halomonas cibimaris]|uniref:Methyltransferase domain-containing protein n=1 Tax=Halomonas cibimaris TaxID=657012 RepID=A0ABP7L8T0_9GAMM